MRKKVDLNEVSGTILKMLPRGILLNTQAEKFDSMVIGWGNLGTTWGRPTFAVYVRESRYTKKALDETGEFTISVPLGDIDPTINRVCGSLSGYEIDKEKEAGLTLCEPEVIRTPGMLEYPLTLECKVVYREDQKEDLIDPEFMKYYPVEPAGRVQGRRDLHTLYIGEIVSVYQNEK